MPGEHEEIGTKLTLDDAASSALKKVGEGFEHVGERVRETAHEMMAMAKQAATFALGFQLNSMIDSVKEFGEEVVHAAMGLDDENKSLAGVLAMVDKGHHSFQELGAQAGGLNEHLERLGVGTGNAKSAMIDAFEMIAEKSTKGASHVEDMVEKMADAAKTLPGGISALSGAWRDLESGIVRPRNALVQLMRQMGVVQGSAKDVAKGLSKLVQDGKQDEVFELAEKAVERMAKRTKEMPLTFGQILQGLGTFRESLFETAGTPIIKALRAQFSVLQRYLEGHREEIEALAKTIGERVGQWVNAAAEKIKLGFQYLQTHAGEIMTALERGGGALMRAVQFVVDHKDLLLAIAAAKMVNGGLGATAAALPGLGSSAGKIVGAIAPALTGGKAFGMTASSLGMTATEAALAGVTASVGAIAVAAGTWYVAVQQANQLEQETGLSTAQSLGHLLSFQGSLFESVDHLQNFTAAQRAFHASSAHSMQDLEHFAHQMEAAGFAAVKAGDMTMQSFSEAMREIRSQIATQKQFASYGENLADMASTAAGSKAVFGDRGLDPLARAYQKAADDNSQEAERAARAILVANAQLVTALGANGVEDALRRLKGLAEKTVGGDDVKLPPINFGPSTFHVHQDFRDQDPDRVAIIFRRDVTRSAVSRIGSRLSSAFGI